jgi:DNA-directed RNA polymerase subunit M/transcription elongation factor TFIIS
MAKIRCTKCGKRKPESDFPLDNRHKNGRCSWCRNCQKALVSVLNKKRHTGKCPNCGGAMDKRAKRCKNCFVREGHPVTIETRKKIGKACKGKLSGDKNPAKRVEVRIKLSNSHLREKNHNWIDGRSNIKYPSEYKQIQPQILERDGYICLKCHKNKEMMDVHHGDHDRNNNKQENLFTLCHQCNVEMEREETYQYWIDYWKMYVKRYLQGQEEGRIQGRKEGFILGRIYQKQLDLFNKDKA